MDRVIDFNEIKNKVNDKDIDKFEGYMYDLYYKMAEGKINMSDFSREISEYMQKNNISQDKFLKIQSKLMERYGVDTKNFEEQLKAFGINNISGDMFDYEKSRKNLSFQEKYKDRLKSKSYNEYFIKNNKNNVVILLESKNVIIRSENKVDLEDNELNEFLCSYRKILDESIVISICNNVGTYEYN